MNLTLAEALNTSVEYLMGLTDDAPPETPPICPTGRQISLPINNMEKENNVDIAYWGSVLDNARRIAKSGNTQDREVALMMLRMAVDAITGSEVKPTGGASIFQKADGVHGNAKQTISTST